MEEIREIIRRLETKTFSLRDIQGAAHAIINIQNPETNFTLAKKLYESAFPQVRVLGSCLMLTLSSLLPEAHTFLKEYMPGNLKDSGKPDATLVTHKETVSIIKQWLRESDPLRNLS